MHLSRSFWASRWYPLFSPDDDGGSAHADDAKSEKKSDDHTDDLDKIDGLGDAGKAAIRKERDAAKAAADEAKTAKAERDALLKEKTDREAKEAKDKEKAAAEAGKFEELAVTRERERDDAKAEAATLKAENDQLKAAMAEGLTSRVKELPESVRETLNDTFADDDVLGRWNWLHKPSVQKLITEKAEVKAGNVANPKSSGDNTLNVAKLTEELRQMRGIRAAR